MTSTSLNSTWTRRRWMGLAVTGGLVAAGLNPDVQVMAQQAR